MKNHRFIVGLLSVFALLATYNESVQQIEQSMFATLSRFLPSSEAGRGVALVAIDEKSLDQLGPWPWTYDKIAAIVAKLKPANLHSLGLLLPLSQSQNFQETLGVDTVKNIDLKRAPEYVRLIKKLNLDDQLSLAIKRHGNVVIPIYFEKTKNGDADPNFGAIQALSTTETNNSNIIEQLSPLYFLPENRVRLTTLPLSIFENPAESIGLTNETVNRENVVSHALATKVGSEYYPSYLLQLITQMQKSAPELVPGKGLEVGNAKYATDVMYNVYPYPPKKKDSSLGVTVYSAVDILQGKVDIKNLKRHYAMIIGLTAAPNVNPISVYDGIITSNAAWTVHSLNAVSENQMYTTLYWSLAVQRALLVALTIYLLLLPSRLRGWLGFAITSVLSIVFINVELMLLLMLNLWQPLVLPTLFVLFGHLVITIHHQITFKLKSLQAEAANAYRELGLNFQAQGRLDQAFNYMQKCPMDKKLLECLYNLGLEFERRRQFNQAVNVYDYIAQKDADYRDIQERCARHQTESNKDFLTSSINPGTATLVVDHPNVARPILGRYQVEKVIGQGAMGTVYLGADPKIGRTVAIKTLPLSDEFENQQLEEVRRRFFREAETAGRLDHPNIVTIYDVGEEHDLAYIAMDLIKGEGLDTYTHPESLLSISDVFHIGITVAEALDYAHSQNVVHRDIKPGNIIFDRDSRKLKVTDFGIACLTDNTRTRTGTVLGSPSYMSPEQLTGDDVDGRSDIYSLGVTIFQLFTGVLPFNADSMASLAYKIANEKPKGIRKIRAELPTCLTRIINKTMEKDPSQRYQNGAALADALRRCMK